MFDEDDDGDAFDCGEMGEDLVLGEDLDDVLTPPIHIPAHLPPPAPAARTATLVSRAPTAPSRGIPSVSVRTTGAQTMQLAAHEVLARAVAHKVTGGAPDENHLQIARRAIRIPGLSEAVTLLRRARVSAQATSEHRRIMARDAFRSEVRASLSRIEGKLPPDSNTIFRMGKWRVSK